MPKTLAPTLALALVLAPSIALADPDPASEPAWRTFFGSIGEGERDDWWEWLDMWYGPGSWQCLTAHSEDVFVLTLLDGSPTDRLTLVTQPGTYATELRALATLATPAVMYGSSSSLCLEFAVEGTHVADVARYRVDIHDEWSTICQVAC